MNMMYKNLLLLLSLFALSADVWTAEHEHADELSVSLLVLGGYDFLTPCIPFNAEIGPVQIKTGESESYSEIDWDAYFYGESGSDCSAGISTISQEDTESLPKDAADMSSDEDVPFDMQTKSTNTRFMCKIKGCNKIFRTITELTAHVRTHTGEKPFACSFSGCSKKFAHCSNLRVHERSHTGEKRHKCRLCGQLFAHPASRNKHEDKGTCAKPVDSVGTPRRP